MVDAIVTFAVERLGDFLIEQANFLQGVKDDVRWLHDELKMMQSLLEDAEEKQDGDHRIRQWISDVRDIAYDAEDVIDTFTLKVKVDGIPKKGFWASVKKCSCFFNEENDLYNIGKDIEALKIRLGEIKRRREDYGIGNIGHVRKVEGGAVEDLRELRRSTPYGDEEHVVGFEDVTASLVDKLFKEEPRRNVISILGMGGLGKTTLARKLYHHGQVKDKFECRGWVCASEECSIPDLLQRLVKSFKQIIDKEELEMLEKMTEEDLGRYLREFLEGRRYLVVIDNVWHQKDWQRLKRAFPDNSNGSRVIVTTRKNDVAEHVDERTDHVHKLRLLRSDESWELFCKKVFCNYNASGGTSHCALGLETLGREMVARCGGLPLGIIVLGGLLSKKQPHEWHTVKDDICWNLESDSDNISQILGLSFKDLPNRLKPCFLYLGLFPEDYEIRTEMLIRMWVAEGFIAPRDNHTPEDVAEVWLNELIGRSLIEVVKRNWCKITEFRVHDLLRDLVVRKAKELNFLHIYDENINSVASSNNTASSRRRQVVHSVAIERYASMNNPNSCLRTLSFFNPTVFEPSSLQPLESLLPRFRLLRVLDFSSISFGTNSRKRIVYQYKMGMRRTSWGCVKTSDPFVYVGFPFTRITSFSYSTQGSTRLPDAIGELIHLRYLGLRDTLIDELPPSLANLQSLQTLDAYSDNICMRLPRNMCKLQQLRHLIGCFENPFQVEHFTQLHTLSLMVDIHDWVGISLMSLTNLRELYLVCTSIFEAEEVEEFIQLNLDCVANFRSLQSLSLFYPFGVFYPSFQQLSHCQHLTHLRIEGSIGKNGKIPEQMHEYLSNLQHLLLISSDLTHDPLPTLAKLPSLIVLELRHNFLHKLTFTANGFRRLEVLRVMRLSFLEEVEVEEGAMPMLMAFHMEECGFKTDPLIPERLSSIRNAGSTSSWEWEYPYYDCWGAGKI